jgi:hypothetical protein
MNFRRCSDTKSTHVNLQSRSYPRWRATGFDLIPFAFVACAGVLGCGTSGATTNVDAGGDKPQTGGTSGTNGGSGGSTGGATVDAGSATQTCVPPANKDNPIAKLSQTGCVDPSHPTMFAASVIPYEVNSPLWSDGADKTRGFALPKNGKIHAKDCADQPAQCTQGPADTGKWVFPIGTVMVKNFLFDGKLVETRLFVRFDETTWVGYSYQWDEAQTDATIVPDDRVQIAFQTGKRQVDWHFPNRVDCMKCHAPSAGSTLGPETAQMNRMVGGMNQIDKFAAMSLFDVAPAKPYKAALVTPYTSQAGSPSTGATLDQRARSYLHANCAICHRPDGDFPNLDLRYDVAFKDTSLCGTAPVKGDIIENNVNLDPGKPDN